MKINMPTMKFNEAAKMILADDKGKADIILPMSSIKMLNNGLLKADGTTFEYGEYALGQMFSKMGMPINYESSLLVENPELVARQFNYFLNKTPDKEVLLRYKKVGKQHILRAMLSDVYAPIDNHHIYEVFGDLIDKKMQIESFFLDDGRSRMRVVMDEEISAGKTSVSSPLKVNDVLKVGFDIINSEIGRSSLQISPVVYRLVCTNGMKAWKREGDFFKQRHAYFQTQDMKQVMREAISNSIQNSDDMVRAFIAMKSEELQNPLEVITDLAKRAKFADRYIELAQENWRIEPEESMYGVINAFTRTAQQTPNDEERIKMEQFAGTLVKL